MGLDVFLPEAGVFAQFLELVDQNGKDASFAVIVFAFGSSSAAWWGELNLFGPIAHAGVGVVHFIDFGEDIGLSYVSSALFQQFQADETYQTL